MFFACTFVKIKYLRMKTRVWNKFYEISPQKSVFAHVFRDCSHPRKLQFLLQPHFFWYASFRCPRDWCNLNRKTLILVARWCQCRVPSLTQKWLWIFFETQRDGYQEWLQREKINRTKVSLSSFAYTHFHFMKLADFVQSFYFRWDSLIILN